jgi:hypothetical protein
MQREVIKRKFGFYIPIFFQLKVLARKSALHQSARDIMRNSSQRKKPFFCLFSLTFKPEILSRFFLDFSTIEVNRQEQKNVDLWKKPTQNPAPIFSTTPHLQRQRHVFLIE